MLREYFAWTYGAKLFQQGRRRWMSSCPHCDSATEPLLLVAQRESAYSWRCYGHCGRRGIVTFGALAEFAQQRSLPVTDELLSDEELLEQAEAARLPNGCRFFSARTLVELRLAVGATTDADGRASCATAQAELQALRRDRPS